MAISKTPGTDKLEFRFIVLTQIKSILDLSSSELRNTTKTIIHSNHTETIENEDTRYAYIQSIENLAYILSPYFDKTIKPKYKESIGVINSLPFEILKKFKKEFDETYKATKDDDLENWFPLRIKIRYAKELFYELNQLLKRQSYLNSAVYGGD